MSSTEISLGRRLTDVIEEYETKRQGLGDALATLQKADADLVRNTTVAGTYGQESLSVSLKMPSVKQMEKNLLVSAWKHIYEGLNIKRRSSVNDKKRFETFFADPKPFTLENIRDLFGDFVANPRQNTLRALAEVFSSLDPAFKSHDKMKIGVKGLPKRIILSGYGSGGWHYHSDQLTSIINALAMVQLLPLVEYYELSVLKAYPEAMKDGGEFPDPYASRHDKNVKIIKVIRRGIWIKQFDNGNIHLYFAPDILLLVNQCLAEYYGDVLADCYDDDNRPAKATGTAVSKDLQYYPTPEKVVQTVLDRNFGETISGYKVLEPSCGCGRFLDALAKRNAIVFGIEYDNTRAAQARAKGHSVLTANFLETIPEPIYDAVVMNPPFYGKHYAKHLRHAYKFLKPGGVLISILPATAKYDHGIIDSEFPTSKYDRNWFDLPVGSFSESGTNINTGIFKTWKPKET